MGGSNGNGSNNAISVCGIQGSRACMVPGPTIYAKGSTLELAFDACWVNILDLADGHSIMKFPLAEVPRSCASPRNGGCFVVSSVVLAGMPIPGEKQKLNLFDCSSPDRSAPPRLVYTYSMKDLGTTFSPDGRLLAVIIDSEAASDPKSDEKTLDVVIIH
jgi:hypothetical protein